MKKTAAAKKPAKPGKRKQVSVVVPMYNEEENARELHQEIAAVCKKHGYVFEIIFIDDGSSDNTMEICRKLKPLKYIRLRKNFGQTAAMDTGIKHARYDYIITMDGDRQNDPNDIPELIEYLEKENLDVVSGWRKSRKDTFMKRFISKGAHFLRNFLINDGIHDSGCSLKIYRKECFRNVTLYGEMHRFIPALLIIRGFKIGELVVNHRPRPAGVTKYNWTRTIKGFIDMLAIWFWKKYALRPLHLLGGFGLLFCMVGVVFAGLTVRDFFRGMSLSDTALPTLTMFLMITGIQLFISGLLADILIKSYHESINDEPYSVKEIIDNK